MSAILYYLIFPLLYLVSLLPFWLLYRVSDFLFFILFYVVGYRKQVVWNNLKNSFPSKTEQELKYLQKEFYKYLGDLILETLKTLTISKETVLNRCRITDASKRLMQELYDEKKSVIMVLGHHGNWEWAGAAFSYTLQHQLFVIYKPLANGHFDRLIYNMRTRSGTKLIAYKNTVRDMLSNKNVISAIAFIADQTPSKENAYWTTFLSQDTPVFWGTEKFSQKFNYPIIYTKIKRVKRGFYEVHIEKLVNDPVNTKEGEISEIHTKRLEKEILIQPETWVWSHKRWKHKR